MRVKVKVVVIVLIANSCCANTFWDEEDEDEDATKGNGVFGDSEDDYNHEALDKKVWDLTKEQRITSMARDMMWIQDPSGSTHDIDLKSDKFKAWRAQVEEVVEMGEDDDEEDNHTYDWFGEDESVYYWERPKRFSSSYFWRITSPSGVPSYILGTVRLPYTDVYSSLPENVRNAFEVSV